jgi:hydrogenase maturation protein HypF
MAKDFAVLRDLAHLSEKEMALLASPISPIILVHKRYDGPYALSPMVAPRTDLLGVMVPYTPLHLLLFNTMLDEAALRGVETLEVLVMTSANLAEEPLVYENDEALERLEPLADVFLMHNRRIVAPSDDSIVRIMGDEARAIRLGRGYAPYPVALSGDPREPAREGCVAGWGPDMKATIALQAGRFALIGPHLGDQETVAAQAFHRRAYEHFKRVFQQLPDTIVADLHPGYYSRKTALQESGASGARFLEVQHHHAHLTSVALECGLDGRLLALALDGTGYGSDGAVWGGEVLLGDGGRFRRVGTLRTLVLPGGESAIAQTWRLALAVLHETDPELMDEVLPQLKGRPFGSDASVVADMLRRNINCVSCTSLGRLFDAFSALMGICTEATYEAQAAIELENAASRAECADALPMALEYDEPRELMLIDWRPAAKAVAKALRREGLHPLALPEEYSQQNPKLMLPDVCCKLARGFIQGLVSAYGEAVRRAAGKEGITRVVLSGGCFQNKLLFEGFLEKLESSGLDVFTHSGVPMNDAGVSLGQLAHGLARRA